VPVDLFAFIHSYPRLVRLWLLACLLGLVALVLLLAVLDGTNKTFANLGNQILVNAGLGTVAVASSLLVGRRSWALWLLIPLHALLFAAAVIIWHRTPPLPE
jgi:hypothetical protein